MLPRVQNVIRRRMLHVVPQQKCFSWCTSIKNGDDNGLSSLAELMLKKHDGVDQARGQFTSVDEPFPDTSQQCTSMTNASRIPKKKIKCSSFKEVATVWTSAAGLPTGWIKEIKTSKSGDKIRKDPYYIDPATGYEFRSLRDAERYLKEKDPRCCRIKPKRRELHDLRWIKNDIPSSNSDNEKLSAHPQTKRQLSLAGELSGDGESFGAKTLSESEAKISKQPQDDNRSDNAQVTSAGAENLEKNSCKNSSKKAQMEK